MAQPNAINPFFTGRVKAGAYDATHGGGISTTAITLSGTSIGYFFGSSGNGFTGTVTGVFMSALTGTGSTVTIKGTNGATIATITSGTSNGVVKGNNAALTNTAIDLTGTVSATSNDALEAGTVFLTYQTIDNRPW